MRKGIKYTVISAASVMLVTGCSIASVDSSHVGLHYTNGPFSDKKFEYCIPTGTRDVGGAADDNFFYPSSQRTFTFDTAEGSDSGPLDVSTADGNVKLILRGQLTFTLNTDCTPYTDNKGVRWEGGRLQKFHETIGRNRQVFSTDEETDVGEGWKRFLNEYVKNVIDKAVDNEGQKYAWADLYAKSDVRGAWEQGVLKAIPELIKSQLGDDLVTVNAALLQRPNVPPQIEQEMLNAQAATLRKVTADTDREAAAKFSSFAEYMQYQQALAVTKAINDGKANINVVPQGSSIVIGPK